MSSIREKGRGVWGKLTGTVESGLDQAQAEMEKLQAQASEASDTGKLRIRARIGETQAKREADEERMRSSLEMQITDANAQISDLEMASSGVTGEAQTKIMRDIEQARAARESAHQKLESSLAAEAAEAESEMTTLEKEAADSPPPAATRILARAARARMRLDAVQQQLQAVQRMG